MAASDGHWALSLADTFGVVDRGGLRAMGVTDRQVDRRVSSGLLVAVHDGVYRHSAAPVTWEGNLLAASLAAGPHAFASHHSAMRLHNIRGMWDLTPEITVVGTVLPTLTGVRVHRIDRLAPADGHRRLGIPVLAPPVALLTLGARAGDRAVENAVHHMVMLGRTTEPRLRDALDRYGGRGRRGVARLRLAIVALPDAGAATESGLELDLLRLVRAAGLPEPSVQHVVRGLAGEFVARLDLAYPDALIDLEADGELWHTGAAASRDDARRDAALRALGWHVERFTAEQIHDRPGSVVRAVRRALATPARSLSA